MKREFWEVQQALSPKMLGGAFMSSQDSNYITPLWDKNRTKDEQVQCKNQVQYAG